MNAVGESARLSQPQTLRFEEQEGEWLAACWRKGAPKTEGTTIAYGPTIEEAATKLLRKLKRKASK